MILSEKHHELVWPPQHLHGHMLEKKRTGSGQHVLAGFRRSRRPARGRPSSSRPPPPRATRLILVIADQLAVAPHHYPAAATGSSPPGPEAGGTNQGSDPCRHMPEKSGIDATPCKPTMAGPAAGVAACAEAGVTAAANVNSKSKLCCNFTSTSLFTVCPRSPRLRAQSIS
jgi:hypothetical protein